MTRLKAAVDQQRNIIITRLINAGILDPSDTTIHSYSLTELLRECERAESNKNKNTM